jgi:hypothetical protein
MAHDTTRPMAHIQLDVKLLELFKMAMQVRRILVL